MTQVNSHGTVRTFTARSRVSVKREVLAYWNTHRSVLGVSLQDFLSRCTMSSDERTVTYRSC